ncbi:MAG TPA: DUF4238 domain-containing protein [Tepidisphaeraceae bacterium]
MVSEDRIKRRQNQHFVPRYFFRLFSLEKKAICALLKSTGRIIESTSIDKQCAKNNFYGSHEVEHALQLLDGNHCNSIRSLIAAAWGGPALKDRSISDLLEFIAVQNARTEFEAEFESTQSEHFAEICFRHFVEHNTDAIFREQAIVAMDAGQVHFKKDRAAAAVLNVKTALDLAFLLSDLSISVLCNQTDYPFIFGDSPVIFYNQWARNVSNRGVIGYQSPGLQIFAPIDSYTLVYLFDPSKYSGKCTDGKIVNLVDRSDISQLNAMQLHQSLNNVYFGDPADASYVSKLWDTHSKSLRPHVFGVEKASHLIADGKLIEDGFIMRRLLNRHPLSLTFSHCTPISESDYKFIPRTPELHARARAK